ncbi:hypothetical protein MRB53_025582 [Persea americana]|uniref:Uncharacterized protein n=1 Tax=Persea americana TaxID=3435 RepID=A0ACC2LFN1_PERAE|nr:hypothetical protein MRB53_025582 [Persea americana]
MQRASMGVGEGAMFNVSEGLFLLYVTVATLFIMSMVIFGCAEDPKHKQRLKERRSSYKSGTPKSNSSIPFDSSFMMMMGSSSSTAHGGCGNHGHHGGGCGGGGSSGGCGGGGCGGGGGS